MRDTTGLAPPPSSYIHAECLHGARQTDPQGPGATIYPMPLTLAASFDRDLLHRVATQISDEARALDNHMRATMGIPGYADRRMHVARILLTYFHKQASQLLWTKHQHLPRPAVGPRRRNVW